MASRAESGAPASCAGSRSRIRRPPPRAPGSSSTGSSSPPAVEQRLQSYTRKHFTALGRSALEQSSLQSKKKRSMAPVRSAEEHVAAATLIPQTFACSLWSELSKRYRLSVNNFSPGIPLQFCSHVLANINMFEISVSKCCCGSRQSTKNEVRDFLSWVPCFTMLL